jgi:hypothetical protein
MDKFITKLHRKIVDDDSASACSNKITVTVDVHTDVEVVGLTLIAPGGGIWCHPAYFIWRCVLTDKAVNLKFYDFSSNFIWKVLQENFFSYVG